MNNIKYIWLDDVRPAPPGYTAVKSVNDVQMEILDAQIRKMDFVLDIDHDLGQYEKDGGNGTKLVLWLIENKLFCPITLHTANPSAREYMQGLIDRYWPKEQRI